MRLRRCPPEPRRAAPRLWRTPSKPHRAKNNGLIVNLSTLYLFFFSPNLLKAILGSQKYCANTKNYLKGSKTKISFVVNKNISFLLNISFSYFHTLARARIDIISIKTYCFHTLKFETESKENVCSRTQNSRYNLDQSKCCLTTTSGR